MTSHPGTPIHTSPQALRVSPGRWVSLILPCFMCRLARLHCAKAGLSNGPERAGRAETGSITHHQFVGVSG